MGHGVSQHHTPAMLFSSQMVKPVQRNWQALCGKFNGNILIFTVEPRPRKMS